MAASFDFMACLRAHGAFLQDDVVNLFIAAGFAARLLTYMIATRCVGMVFGSDVVFVCCSFTALLESRRVPAFMTQRAAASSIERSDLRAHR